MIVVLCFMWILLSPDGLANLLLQTEGPNYGSARVLTALRFATKRKSRFVSSLIQRHQVLTFKKSSGADQIRIDECSTAIHNQATARSRAQSNGTLEISLLKSGEENWRSTAR